MAAIGGSGVVAVDVDALHRLDLVGGAGLHDAGCPPPHLSPAEPPAPAELLTLAAGDIDLAVA